MKLNTALKILSQAYPGIEPEKAAAQAMYELRSHARSGGGFGAYERELELAAITLMVRW